MWSEYAYNLDFRCKKEVRVGGHGHVEDTLDNINIRCLQSFIRVLIIKRCNKPFTLVKCCVRTIRQRAVVLRMAHLGGGAGSLLNCDFHCMLY